MPNIRVLSQHVADLIAAGEVVERPASVAKELIENSIDAGASFITVEIRSGGIKYLRVTDDGSGIEKEDVPTAILRHSTSKIRNEDDLDGIATLGFRGEALAATCAVTKLSITTRRLEDEMGTQLYQEGGKIISVSETGCAKGTTIVASEMFYNTPARMKFLKKDTSEGAAVEAVVIAAALSNPGISFQFIREGKVTLHTPGDGKTDSCVYSVLGREIANSMLEARSDNGVVLAHGYVSKPIAARGNRALQYFFVNGRYVKSKMLCAAVEQAYANLIMKGRFPACVINITLPFELCDVNVHPTKTEIKFAREREVFDAVYHAVKNALLGDSSLCEAALPSSPKLPAEREEVRYTSAKPMNFNVEKPHVYTPSSTVVVDIPHNTAQKPDTVITKKPEMPINREVPRAVSEELQLALFSDNSEYITEKKENIRYIGEVLNTYLIVECNSDLIMIDKHAAHERILFEKLKISHREPQAQRLIVPLRVKLTEHEIEAILESNSLLNSLGFELDRIDIGEIAVRQVPDGIDEAEIPAAICEIAETLENKKRIGKEEQFDTILHSVACKAAIKAGRKTDPIEAEKLACEVLSRDDIRYCPHGRPVAITLTKNELEKMFRRA